MHVGRAGLHASQHGYLGLRVNRRGATYVRPKSSTTTRAWLSGHALHGTCNTIQYSTRKYSSAVCWRAMHISARAGTVSHLAPAQHLPKAPLVGELLIPGRPATCSRQACRLLVDTAHLLVVMFMEHLLHLCMGPGLRQGVKVVLLQTAVSAASVADVCSPLQHCGFPQAARGLHMSTSWLATATIRISCYPTRRLHGRHHVHGSSIPFVRHLHTASGPRSTCLTAACASPLLAHLSWCRQTKGNVLQQVPCQAELWPGSVVTLFRASCILSK